MQTIIEYRNDKSKVNTPLIAKAVSKGLHFGESGLSPKDIIILIMALGAFTLFAVFGILIATNAKSDSAFLTQDWQLGDSILPPPLYSPSDRLDCDDATLYEYIYFKSIGYTDLTIKYGNLETTGENYWTSNHFWLIVNGAYPYDLGYCIQDDQHFEGTNVSYQDLLRSALRD